MFAALLCVIYYALHFHFMRGVITCAAFVCRLAAISLGAARALLPVLGRLPCATCLAYSLGSSQRADLQGSLTPRLVDDLQRGNV
jgi:hypothetical protein